MNKPWERPSENDIFNDWLKIFNSSDAEKEEFRNYFEKLPLEAKEEFNRKTDEEKETIFNILSEELDKEEWWIAWNTKYLEDEEKKEETLEEKLKKDPYNFDENDLDSEDIEEYRKQVDGLL